MPVDPHWSGGDHVIENFRTTSPKFGFGIQFATDRRTQTETKCCLLNSSLSNPQKNMIHSKFSYVFFVLFATLAWSSHAFTQDADCSDSSSGEPVTTKPNTVAVDGVSSDAAIVNRLTGILEASEWFENVEVKSEEGFVSISAVTSSDEHAQWAERIATRTQDVIGVNNQIKVDSQIDFGQSMAVVAKSLNKLYRDFLLRLPFLIAGMAVIMLTWIAARMVKITLDRFLDSREKMRTSLKDLIKQLAGISVWIAGLLTATIVVFPGMTPSKALTVLGLGSVAIGFAFKDIFENFFAGVLILWRYPIEKGDFVEHNEVVGKVEEITIRNTMIRRADGELVIVPNGQLFKSNVEVLTNRPKRRVRITCGVAYRESVPEARKVIREAVAGCESISGPKSVEVYASEFADSSVNFEVAWWTGSSPLDIRKSRDEVIEAIKEALDGANIEIPFPYRTLTFANPNFRQA